MPKEINRRNPIARKQHKCNFCGGIIEKGEKYDNATLEFDGTVYTWKSHLHCLNIASEYDFDTWIKDYVHDNHYDDEIDDICVEWQNKSIPELAKMIDKELHIELK